MKENPDKIVFRSRQSVLLILFLLVMFIPALISVFKLKDLSAILILTATILFVIIIFAGIRYIISGDILYLKIIFIPAGKIKTSNISLIKRSYNPLSAPAASLKRLQIDYTGGKWSSFTLISPVKEDEFIAELKKINPNISVKVTKKKGVWRIWDWDV